MNSERPEKRHKRLTMTELRQVVEFYHSKFPDWKLIQKDTIVREDGPVVQGITFERLSGGDYRPIGHVRVLVAPEDVWAFELYQDLNIKVRQINRREHPEICDRVVAAICEEFVPNVDEPLAAQEVLQLYEQRANPARSPDAYSLAPLNAYLGQNERAMYWSSRFTELVDESGNPWQDHDHKRRAFLDQLEKWLRAGDAKDQLERVLQGERRKWGLVS